MFHCKGCENPFELVSVVPNILRCGHTFCIRCIRQQFRSEGFFECLDCNYFTRDLAELIVNRVLCERRRGSTIEKKETRMLPPTERKNFLEQNKEPQETKQKYKILGNMEIESCSLNREFQQNFFLSADDSLPFIIKQVKCSKPDCPRLTDAKFCSIFCAMSGEKNTVSKKPPIFQPMKAFSAVKFGGISEIGQPERLSNFSSLKFSKDLKSSSFFGAQVPSSEGAFFQNVAKCKFPDCPNPFYAWLDPKDTSGLCSVRCKAKSKGKYFD